MSTEIVLREVREQDLGGILELYNDTENFKFATGIENPTDIGTIELQYHMVQIDPARTLFGIWSVEPSTGKELMVGVADAIVNHPEEGWGMIGLLLIAPEWQRKGVGTKALGMVEECLQQKFGVRAFTAGMIDHEAAPLAFWLKLGYNVGEVKRSHTLIEGSPRDLMLLDKHLDQDQRAIQLH